MIRARLFQTVLLKPLCGGGGEDDPRHSREVETKSSFVPAGVQVESPAAASAPLPRSPRARPQRSGSRGSPGAAGSAGPGLSPLPPPRRLRAEHRARAGGAAASGAARGAARGPRRPLAAPFGVRSRAKPRPHPPPRYSPETCVTPGSTQGPHLCRTTKPGLPEHRHSPLRAALSVRILLISSLVPVWEARETLLMARCEPAGGRWVLMGAVCRGAGRSQGCREGRGETQARPAEASAGQESGGLGLPGSQADTWRP